jgi:AraC family transcriptional regulator
MALRRVKERLRSDSGADVSLAALAADAGLWRFQFCRAFKQGTGLSPHAWLRQHQLEQAMVMLRDTDGLVAMALGKHALQATPSAFLDEFAR